MNCEISFSDSFLREMKRLRKKYRSIDSDLATFITRLRLNPKERVALGKGVHKVRLPISSKSRGKSDGARVITHTLLIARDDVTVTLLAIYDKSARETISDAELRELLKNNVLL